MRETTHRVVLQADAERHAARLRARRRSRTSACALLLLAAFVISCRYSSFRTQTGMPPQAQAVIDAFSKDMTEGRYEKIYNDAAEEWRRISNVEQTRQFFATLREKLGPVKVRTQQTIRDQNNSGGDVPGHSLVIVYQTAFERAEGMETFTLVDRDGRWLLAGYFVNSNALK
jgi:hypothetical protein